MEIVRACLALDRRRRYASVAALLRDVRRHLAGEPVSVAPEGAAARTKRWLSRHARVAAAGAIAIALLLLTVTAASTLIARESGQRAAALEQAVRAEAQAAQAGLTADAASLAERTARGELDRESAKREQAELEARRANADRAEAAQRRVRAFQPYAGAMDLVRRGQRLDQATALARSALEIDGDFVEAAFLLGETLRAQGQQKAAAEAFLRADAIAERVTGRHSAPAQLAAALAYDAGGWMVESAAAYDLIDAEERDPLAEVGRALRELRGFAYVAARARVDGLCADAPHLWEAHYARAGVYAAMAEDGVIDPDVGSREADASARRAVELAPDQALAQAQLSLCALRMDDRAPALDRAIALEPANGAWLALRAERALVAGDAAASRVDADAARRLGVAPARLALLAVREAIVAGDHEANFRALTALKDELVGWPKEQMSWAYLGLALHHDEVMPTLRGMFERYPIYPMMAQARALAAHGVDRDAQAIAVLRESLVLHPFNGQLREAEAYYCARAGRHDEALAALDRIDESRLSQGDAFIVRRLRIATLEALGRGEEARALRDRTRVEFASRAAELDQAMP